MYGIDHISRRQAARGSKWLSFFSIRQGIEGLLAQDSPESLFYAILYSFLVLLKYMKTDNRLHMSEKTLTGTQSV